MDILIIIIVFLIFVAIYFFLMSNPTQPFVDTKVRAVQNVEPFQQRAPDGVYEEVIGQDITYPTARNPFMNVLIDEIKYNPTRPEAASVLDPSVSTSLDSFFKTQFTNDPTDVFNRSQSQRQFYVTPSTTVPNDVDSYQNWLYRIPGKTCKEGGREACALQSGTAGAVVPWLTEN